MVAAFTHRSDDVAASLHSYVLWFVLPASIASVVLFRWFSGKGVTALDFAAVGIALVAVGGYTTYASWASKRGALPIGLDQAGDNAYYIGLLLTFTSLGVALVKLVILIGDEADASARGVAVDRIAQLIPDFGVALASTIFGIAARLWLQQHRTSPAEASEQVRRDLDLAAAGFARNLRVATGTINTSVNTVRLGIAKQLEEAVYGQVETFEEAQQLVRDAAKTMSDGLAELARALNAVNGKVAAEAAALGEAKSSASLRDLGDHARGASVAVTQLSHECAAATKQISAVSTQLDALEQRLAVVAPRRDAGRLDALVQDAISKTEHIVDVLARTDSHVSASESLLHDAVTDLGIVGTVAGRAANATEQVEDKLTSAETTARALANGLKETSDRTRVLQKRIESATDDVAAAVQQTEGAAKVLGTQVRTVVDELRTLEADVGTLQQAVEDARTGIAKVAGQTRELLPPEEAGLS